MIQRREDRKVLILHDVRFWALLSRSDSDMALLAVWGLLKCRAMDVRHHVVSILRVDQTKVVSTLKNYWTCP
jgi:hypothetical protein